MELTTSFSSKSYLNLNAAYIGFYSNPLENIVVNDGNLIKVISGTFSQPFFITVDNKLLSAKSLKLVPTSDTLHFDKENYILTQEIPQTSFKIGCPVGTIQFLYYII